MFKAVSRIWSTDESRVSTKIDNELIFIYVCSSLCNNNWIMYIYKNGKLKTELCTKFIRCKDGGYRYIETINGNVLDLLSSFISIIIGLLIIKS